MIAEEITKEIYSNLTHEQKLKLALYSDFDGEAKAIYDWLNEPKAVLTKPSYVKTNGVYYLYEDGTSELFDYHKQNKPTKAVARIGLIWSNYGLSIGLIEQEGCELVITEDDCGTPNYIDNRDDAVADLGGKFNTEHIKAVGTDIKLEEIEWIPSMAEAYLLYLNKRAINAALALCGGEPIHNDWYWTSTEFSYNDAWGLNLDYGYLYCSSKITKYQVRPVAAFH